MPVLPSRTIPSANHRLAVRQNDPSSTSFVPVPSTYGGLDGSPHPGVVAGIVLGSVAGFLLLLYLVYVILHRGPVIIPVDESGAPMSSVGGDTSTFASRSVITLKSKRGRKHRRTRSNGSRRSKATTVRSSRERSRRRVSPVIVDPPPPERIIVEPPLSPSSLSSIPPPPRPHYAQESTISGMSSSDNEIVVEEEHSPSPPRRYSQRYSQEQRYRRDSYRDYSPRRESRRYSRD